MASCHNRFAGTLTHTVATSNRNGPVPDLNRGRTASIFRPQSETTEARWNYWSDYPRSLTTRSCTGRHVRQQCGWQYILLFDSGRVGGLWSHERQNANGHANV
jgi:hypothetical protein